MQATAGEDQLLVDARAFDDFARANPVAFREAYEKLIGMLSSIKGIDGMLRSMLSLYEASLVIEEFRQRSVLLTVPVAHVVPLLLTGFHLRWQTPLHLTPELLVLWSIGNGEGCICVSCAYRQPTLLKACTLCGGAVMGAAASAVAFPAKREAVN